MSSPGSGALWLSWMLQQVGPAGRESELPPFAYTLLEGFHKEFPGSSLGVLKDFCNAASMRGCSVQTPLLPSCIA